MDQLQLAAVGTAVSIARSFTVLRLRTWSAGYLAEEAKIVVSELATNAVKATGVVDPHPGWGTSSALNLITVRLLGLDDAIVIEVWDAEPTRPMLALPVEDDESGRGLVLVEALARRWGTYAAHGGKVVWAELALFPAGHP
ncbi:ATP-binding protein [Streptomyces sp. B8F3]|uniref:ATP-binding protein n=1 Tax=Streptomyces sp. B8F3 TaxID=3153573 RepID=UPI00325F62D4